MATITGVSLINNAAIILQDVTNVRWTRPELLGWLNAGQREIVLLKPEASVTNAALQLAANATKQRLPANGICLLKLTRNMGADGATPGDAIRVVDGEVLDAQRPTWHTDANGVGKIQHYVFDPHDPRTFYVFPKAPTSAWYVESVYSSAPVDTNDSGAVIGVDDIYANALTDYVLYRAYSKDAEYAQNGQLALAHYTAFSNAIGAKQSAEQRDNPNLNSLPFNPNVPKP